MKNIFISMIIFLSIFISISILPGCSNQKKIGDIEIIEKDDTSYVDFLKDKPNWANPAKAFRHSSNISVDTKIIDKYYRGRYLFDKFGSGYHAFTYQLYINDDGKIEKIRILKGMGEELDHELITLLNDLKYEPYKIEGEPLKFKYVYRIQVHYDQNGNFSFNRRLSAPKEINDQDFVLLPDKDPTPIGGYEGIAKRIKYPESAQQNLFEGKVSVKVYIDESGNVVDAMILSSVSYDIDSTAYAAIMNTKFEPALVKNKPVKSQFVIPIYFKLEEQYVEVTRKHIDSLNEKLDRKRISLIDSIKANPEWNTATEKFFRSGSNNVKQEKSDTTFYVAVEEMPEPIGGLKAIQEKIIYPEIAKRAGVEGKIYVLAFIDEYGSVVKTQIIRGLGAGLDEAAIKAVKETKFIPGRQRGVPVKVQVSIPMVFRLE